MKTRILLITMMVVSSLILNAQNIMNIHQSNGTVLQFPLNTIDSITYTINNPGNLATIITLPINNIGTSTAISGGNITNNGGTAVTQRGIVWSTSPNPTTANNSTNNGGGTGNFTSILTGLTATTTYYVRAYAINTAGTAYGNELSFATTAGAGSITALNCNSATNNGTLTAGALASEVSSIVPYTVGNGGSYNSQTVNSTGITGLTAILSSGSFANGSGSLTYTISGTPFSAGTASFALNIGGQTCTLTRAIDTPSLSNPGAGVTFDGYVYATIVLGNGQEWMAENLITSTYANGDPIPNVIDEIQWQNLTTGAWSHLYNDSQYENPYGKLYNRYAVTDSRNVCPTGWHIPSDTEWSAFINYLDPNADGGSNATNTAGGKMKSTGTQYWLFPNQDATNESGFSGLPGGKRSSDGIFYVIGGEGRNGHWWSSTQFNPSSHLGRKLDWGSGAAAIYNYADEDGLSVRCLRD